jgi:hypothetical protein
MTTQEPYNFRRSSHNSYHFSTDKNVLYSIDFTDGSYYFNGLPDYLSIFEFSINVLSLGDNIAPPHDKRVETTIVKILSAFLSSKENCIIYMCQNSDNRHSARKRKFDSWFQQNTNTLFEKHDLTIKYEEVDYFMTLIINNNNSNKSEIIELFFDLPNQYGK